MLLYPVHKRQSAANHPSATTAPAAAQRPKTMQAAAAADQSDDRMDRAFQRALKEAQRWKAEYATAKAALEDAVAQNSSLRRRGQGREELALAAPEELDLLPDPSELNALRAKYTALKAHSRRQDVALAASHVAADDARRQARELKAQLDRQARELQSHVERQAKWQARAETHERELAHTRKQLEAVQGLQRDLQAARKQLDAAQGQAKDLKAARQQLDAANGRLVEVKRIQTEAAAARQQAQELTLSRTQLQTAQQRTRETLQKAQHDLARSADMLAKVDKVLQICACVHEQTPLAQALHESREGITAFLASVRAPAQA